MKKPTIKEIASHMNNTEEALLFFNYYESQGWKVGKNPMKSWKSAASGWLTRNKKRQTKIEKAISNEGQAVVDKFWVRMSQIYGSKWVSNYGTEPTKPWIDFISYTSNEKLAHGLDAMIKEADDWPPSLSRFAGLCRSYQPKLKAIGGRSEEEILALRDRIKQTRESEINKIRGLLC